MNVYVDMGIDISSEQAIKQLLDFFQTEEIQLTIGQILGSKFKSEYNLSESETYNFLVGILCEKFGQDIHRVLGQLNSEGIDVLQIMLMMIEKEMLEYILQLYNEGKEIIEIYNLASLKYVLIINNKNNYDKN